MAEFQWWLLIVGLVAGGGLVAVVSMDGRRREEDLAELERRAEATWIADQLGWRQDALDPETVDAVLRAHREYLGLPPPDRLIVEGEQAEPALEAHAWRSLDGDADGTPDQIRDDGRGDADEDLPGAAEQERATGEEAHAGAHGEQRAN